MVSRCGWSPAAGRASPAEGASGINRASPKRVEASGGSKMSLLTRRVTCVAAKFVLSAVLAAPALAQTAGDVDDREVDRKMT